MKKIISLMIICIVTGGILIGCSNQEKKEVYYNNKHTVETFGENDRYCIYKFSNKMSIKDRKNDSILAFDLIGYKNIKPYLYARSEDCYIKLNYDTSKSKISTDLSDFSKDDQKIFKEINKK